MCLLTIAESKRKLDGKVLEFKAKISWVVV